MAAITPRTASVRAPALAGLTAALLPLTTAVIAITATVPSHAASTHAAAPSPGTDLLDAMSDILGGIDPAINSAI
ncbi:hypothetical protein [Actinomadura rubrisoli]|uniref:Uncharacterized protein n=1 Tax=Actinomadura rubrisoli TaxID=2530368 RepID=A0A4R5B9P8_9ACTN|nr:hypothetical protein [Actinomadura rubrisoli]TDD81306.1 hypothetical protein E1298_24325 [Actinomadura rubrisoli]